MEIVRNQRAVVLKQMYYVYVYHLSLLSDYCCHGPVGMLGWKLRGGASSAFQYHSGPKAASIMHEDQYTVAL